MLFHRSAALLLGAGLLAASATRAVDQPAGPAPEQRYEEARLLMQRGRYLEAADAYRSVAESADTPPALRAQALFTAGLMEENARHYERAVATYEEVQRRFPDSSFAARAAQTLTALEQGGPGPPGPAATAPPSPAATGGSSPHTKTQETTKLIARTNLNQSSR